MYVNKLRLHNIKSIKKTAVKFAYPRGELGSNINLLLGNNGTGKTTILAGIALAVLSPIIESSGYFARHLVTFGEERGSCEAELILGNAELASKKSSKNSVNGFVNTRLDLMVRGRHTELNWVKGLDDDERILNALYDDDNPEFFLLGYGATRRVDSTEDVSSRQKSRSLRYQRVAGLFEDHYALVPIVSVLIKENFATIRGQP